MSERRVVYARVTPAELKLIDERAKAVMRNRNSYVLWRLVQVADDTAKMPTKYPDVVANSEAVALFLRLPEEVKEWVVASASDASVSTSRFVRGVLFS